MPNNLVNDILDRAHRFDLRRGETHVEREPFAKQNKRRRTLLDVVPNAVVFVIDVAPVGHETRRQRHHARSLAIVSQTSSQGEWCCSTTRRQIPGPRSAVTPITGRVVVVQLALQAVLVGVTLDERGNAETQKRSRNRGHDDDHGL